MQIISHFKHNVWNNHQVVADFLCENTKRFLADKGGKKRLQAKKWNSKILKCCIFSSATVAASWRNGKIRIFVRSLIFVLWSLLWLWLERIILWRDMFIGIFFNFQIYEWLVREHGLNKTDRDRNQNKNIVHALVKIVSDQKVSLILFPILKNTCFFQNTVFMGDNNIRCVE